MWSRACSPSHLDLYRAVCVVCRRSRHTSRSLPELIFGVVSEALRTAGCTMNDVDGVVIATHELIDGRSLSDGDAAGERLSDEKRVSVEFSDKPRGRITDFHFVLD